MAKLILKSFYDNGNATLGTLSVDGRFAGFSLEDEEREIKVKGETRIPRGTYKIGYREVLSGLTKKYRDKYPWFGWHLEIKDVPGFNYVYLHIGNTDKHTDGCVLIGSTADKDSMTIGRSKDAFKPFYLEICEYLDKGEPVTITLE